MFNVFACARYLLFALSIICSAVIASVAVWNLGYTEAPSISLPHVVQVDSYVIFVGGFTLLATFVVIFSEVGRGRNSLTSRVWIDCSIAFLYFLLNLGSASVVTALLPSRMCSGDQQLPSGACTSTRILQSFTWLFTIILLVYFLTIFITVFIRSSDSKLWSYSVYQLSSYESNNSVRLQSPPSSPIPTMLHRFIRPPPIAAPRPQRAVNAVPNLMPYAYRSGLSPDYQIEHFQFPLRSDPRPLGQIQRPPIAGAGPSNLYPEFLRSSLLPNALLAPSSSRRNSSVLPGGAAPPQATTQASGSPPPLGNWPRSDIMQQVSRRSTRRMTPQTVSVPQNHDEIQGPNGSISRSKPSGPRTRAGSHSGGTTNTNHPAPLDLSNISSLRPNR
ncbi:hypothetical protein GYMLUDRAFT_44247 [Collybiopsis luxurians FD-317 M1]|jgi:hypothetical protein|uniref:MARVEL domain-containing protein n=1 Tax=Collybiopsis luxurians FD-317 M1 TaxID=944289 RepID=A0A0D0B8A2_9AGAR|nr:hypothetical protein GYMLUDRAFT_44247 [Collybiopsis luxurians FD-317 M1]